MALPRDPLVKNFQEGGRWSRGLERRIATNHGKKVRLGEGLTEPRAELLAEFTST